MSGLSPGNEQFLVLVVSTGLYHDRTEALDDAGWTRDERAWHGWLRRRRLGRWPDHFRAARL